MALNANREVKLMKKFQSAKRTHGIPTSIFSTMSKLAVEHKAVNLGQGFPDFDGPPWIMEKAFEAMRKGKNQYAPGSGILSLRKAIAEVDQNHYGLEWEPDNEITVTAGATEALYSTIASLVNPGDEVIMFEPFYDAHQANVVLAGGIPRYVTLKKPDFSFDFDELEKLITPATKMIILNTPHNPTGKVFSDEELAFIAETAVKNDLIVISDEVYEFLTYDDVRHKPIASYSGMRERTVTISSTGKTFGMTGWKIGYAVAQPSLTEAIRKVHQWTIFAVNTPGQHAMAYGFGQLNSYLPDFRAEYQKKRDIALRELEGSAFKAHKPLGSYFIMVDIPEGLFENDIDAAKRLVTEHGIATIPPSVFYAKSDEGQSMLRLCFAKEEKTLIEGTKRLKAIA